MDKELKGTLMLITKKAWCASSPPTGERLQATNTALDSLAQRGQDCAQIAQKGRQLLQNYGLRYYPDGTIGKGGQRRTQLWYGTQRYLAYRLC